MNVDDYLSLVYNNLAGEISSEDFALLNRLTAQREDLAKARFEYEAMWDAFSNEDVLTTKQETVNLFNKITSGADIEQGKIIQLNTTDSVISKSPTSIFSVRKIIATISSIAAIFIVVVGLWFAFRTQAIMYDSPGVYDLADGSQVTLRNGKLTINTFDKIQRNVALEGEAIFKVNKDPNRPFVVASNQISIQVLGTEFLVKNVGRETYIHLFEGKIKTVDSRSQETAILLPGMHVKHTDQGKIITEEEYKNLSVWNNGHLQYKNTTLANAIHELSFIFDRDIKIEDKTMQACALSAVINSKELKSILERISSSFQMELVREENTWILKGGKCK